jgi:receptor protein-tyrosine kinase
MSKHFELMQQMEEDQPSVAPPPPAPAPAPVFQPQRAHALGVSTRRWASEEALRLVQQIFLVQAKEPPRIVVFAGVDHGNGCSQICASVAETLAKNARRPVCLLEANFRSPGLSELFGTTNHHGLTEALRNQGPMGAFAKRVSQDNLWLLSAGQVASDSANLLTSTGLGERLAELRTAFDFVIIDAPPLTRYSDAVVLGQLSDGLVMVLEADATRRDAALAAAANLRTVNVPILAAVLNKRTFPIPETIYQRL